MNAPLRAFMALDLRHDDANRSIGKLIVDVAAIESWRSAMTGSGAIVRTHSGDEQLVVQTTDEIGQLAIQAAKGPQR